MTSKSLIAISKSDDCTGPDAHDGIDLKTGDMKKVNLGEEATLHKRLAVDRTKDRQATLSSGCVTALRIN
jgi:hypothetical protein